MNEEFLRKAVQHLKIRFVRYQEPPVELPAESLIYDVIKEILEAYEVQRAYEYATTGE